MTHCNVGQIFLSLQATELRVASGKRVACTFCSVKSSRGGFKRSTTLAGSHLVSSVDIVYVHSLNPLLLLRLIYYPALHPAPPMPERGFVDTLPARGGLFILNKGKKEHVNAGFSLTFGAISKQFALKRKRFLLYFHEDS